MPQSRRLLRNPLVLVAAAGLVLAGCRDRVPVEPNQSVVPSIPGPLFDASIPSNGTGACMGNDAAAYPVNAPGSLVSGYNGDPNTFNCTANDVSVATTSITQYFDPNTGQFVNYDPNNPPHCNQGSTITLKLTATLQENASSERQDIGFWVNTAGGSGLSGSCNHYNIPPGTAGSTNGDADQCAGLGVQASTTIDLGTITVQCNADPTNSKLQLGSCITWKVPGETNVCADDADGNGTAGQPSDFRAGTLPTNKAKCNCAPFDINVLVDQFASIEVKKVCSPTTDPGTFDLNIDGSTKKNDATCGSTTGPIAVGAGTNVNPGATHSVSENDFTTADYVSSYACTKNGSPYISSTSGTGPFNVTVQPRDAVVCTFTNVRKGSITIVKDAVPNDPQDFAFTTTGSGLSSFSLDDDADPTLSNTKTFTNLVPGSYSVTETALTGWDLSNLSCTQSGTGTSSSTDVPTATATITLGAGGNVTCTYTNTKRGSITIIKDAVPNAAQDFAYTSTGGLSPSGFSLDDDADPTLSNTQSYTNVAPGNYTVTEGAVSGWKLTGLSCNASGTGTTGSGNTTTGVATIALGAGGSVTCTYTNTELGTVTVQKIVVGGGATVFDFTRTVGVSSFSLGNGQTNSTGQTVLPGTYTVCERNIPVGWALTSVTVNGTSVTPTNPDSPQDLGSRCVTFTVTGGGTTALVFTNSPPPGGNARTIGYWKNWSSCAQSSGKQYTKALSRNEFNKTLDGNLPQTLGLLTVTTCQAAVNILNKSDLSGIKRASDPLFNMAAQLLAAELNISAGADPKCIQPIIDAANALLVKYHWNGTYPYSPTLTSADATLANQYATLLDKYNNNTLVCPIP
jgi:Prealbumin-like fold domain